MDRFSPPVEITSPMVRAFFDYWLRKRAGRVVPLRSDIDPGDIKRLLPYICICEILQDPFDVRFRLVGTAVAEAAGYDFTGRRLREMPVMAGEQRWIAHYSRVVTECRPFYGRFRGELGPDRIRYVDHGAFPLSTDGARIDRIIQIEDWGEIQGVALGKPENSLWRFEPFEID